MTTIIINAVAMFLALCLSIASFFIAIQTNKIATRAMEIAKQNAIIVKNIYNDTYK